MDLLCCFVLFAMFELFSCLMSGFLFSITPTQRLLSSQKHRLKISLLSPLQAPGQNGVREAYFWNMLFGQCPYRTNTFQKGAYLNSNLMGVKKHTVPYCIALFMDVMNLASSIWYKAGNKQVREFAGKFRAIPIERQAVGFIGAGSQGDLGWSL